jgi:hypothetical protein
LFVLVWTAAAHSSIACEPSRGHRLAPARKSAKAAQSAADRGPSSSTFVNLLAHPAIDYGSRPTRDPVSDLIRRMQNDRVELESEGPSGYLRSLLQTLNVPIESQIVVFPPDTVQGYRITRRSA